MAVKMDNGRDISFNPNRYAYIRHGYAMTVHKAQGVTVDHAKVLATNTFDKHLAYVSLSRHRESVSIYAGKDQLADKGEMVRCFRRLNRQESVHTFAQRHGLDVGEDDASRFKPEHGRGRTNDVVGRVMAAHKKEADKKLLADLLSGASGDHDARKAAQAKKTLESAASRYFKSDLKKINKLEKDLAKKVQDAIKDKADHETTRPKPVLGLGKRRLNQWKTEHGNLTAGVRSVQHDLSEFKRVGRKRLESEAKAAAHKKAHSRNGLASKTLADYEKKLKQQKKMKEIEKKRALMKEFGKAHNSFKAAQKSKDIKAANQEEANLKRIILRIERDSNIRRYLDEIERLRIKQVKKQVRGFSLGIRR